MCIDRHEFLGILCYFHLEISLAQVMFAKMLTTSQIRKNILYVRQRILFCKKYLTETLKSPHRRTHPFRLTTGTIGVAIHCILLLFWGGVHMELDVAYESKAGIPLRPSNEPCGL